MRARPSAPAPCSYGTHATSLGFLLILLNVPATSAAQAPDAFADALVTFTVAVQGTYGDEGPQVLAALTTAEQALAAWDQEIRTREARVAADAALAAPSRLAQLHTDLAAVYLTRGRSDDARRALATARALDASQASATVRLGMLHERRGNTAEAMAAFQDAWRIEPSDPTVAYLLWRHRPPAATPAGSDLLDALGAWYERMPPSDAEARTPFPHVTLVPEGTTPLLPMAHYAEGFRSLERGDLAGALAVLREQASADPLVTGSASADPGIRPAIAALRAGRLPDAQAALREVVARLDNTPEAHRLLGVAYAADYQYDAAIDHLRRAVALDPQNERARLTLVRTLVQQDRLLDAEALLTDTITVLPDSTSAHWWLGTVYASLNRTIDAQRIFERAAELPALAGRRDLLATIGRFRTSHADFEGAIAAHTARIRADPNDALAHLDLASAYVQQDRQDDAFAEYVAALLVQPRLPAAHVGIGQYHLAAGRTDAAVLALERAVNLQPRSTEARYALALALRGAGRTQEAAAQLHAFNELQTQEVAERRRTMTLDVLKEEAALRTAEGAHADAAALWERVVQSHPTSASHHASLAASLAAAGLTAEAVARYEHAATLSAEPYIFRALAALYAAQGRTQESLAARERYEQTLLKALGGAGTGR